MSDKDCPTGPDDRCRDINGEIRRKIGSTRVDTLRETYGPNFAGEFRGDMKLENLLERTGARSLSEFLKHHR